jgi:NodT family efflux transporter outer membrane factor (OMF) lipoprotein
VSRHTRLPAGAGVALALLLSACANSGGLVPQGRLTEVQSLQAAKALTGVPLTPAAWPQRDWWRAVGDPQLDALIDEALAGSPTLDTARARSSVAIAQAQAVDAERQPTLKASGQYSGIRIPDTVLPAPYGGSYNTLEALSLQLSWSPDLWGGQRAAWEAALGRVRAAQIDEQAARIALSIQIAESYATMGYGFDQRDVAQAELDRAKTLLALTQQRVNAGIDSQLQLKQAAAAVPAAQQQLQAAQLRIDGARAALAALLGQGPDRGLTIERPKAVAPTALALPSVLPAELLGRRPDLVAARWRAQAAQREVDADKTRFYPNINLSAAAGLASAGIENLFESASRYYQLGPAISLPIFDGGRLRANLAGSDAQFDLAAADYNQKLVDALRDVATSITTLNSLAQQRQQAQQSHALAQQAYDLALQRYRDGIGNYLEVLSARSPLLQSEAALAELHIRQLDASLQLVQALGGGWQDDGPAPDAPGRSLHLLIPKQS